MTNNIDEKISNAYYNQLVSWTVLYLREYYDRETVEVFLRESDIDDLKAYSKNYLIKLQEYHENYITLS